MLLHEQASKVVNNVGDRTYCVVPPLTECALSTAKYLNKLAIDFRFVDNYLASGQIVFFLTEESFVQLHTVTKGLYRFEHQGPFNEKINLFLMKEQDTNKVRLTLCGILENHDDRVIEVLNEFNIQYEQKKNQSVEAREFYGNDIYISENDFNLLRLTDTGKFKFNNVGKKHYNVWFNFYF